MKSVKMIGLEDVVSEQIKQFRIKEIAAFKVVRWIALSLGMTCKFT